MAHYSINFLPTSEEMKDEKYREVFNPLIAQDCKLRGLVIDGEIEWETIINTPRPPIVFDGSHLEEPSTFLRASFYAHEVK